MRLMDILTQYSGRNLGQPVPEAPEHFEEVARKAPPEIVSQGLAEAFRSDRTPPFSQMLGDLFHRSRGEDRVGILNLVLEALDGDAIGGPLGELAGGGGITAAEAERVPPEMVQEAAAYAEAEDPEFVERVSDFLARHPDGVKGLGTTALTIALARMAQRTH